jgi:hypothetical protein
MNIQALPLEIELAILKVAAQYNPNTRYNITTTMDEYEIKIEFEGFYTESSYPTNRPYKDPNHQLYRNPKVDFWIQYFRESQTLAVCGWWRTCILTLHYGKSSQFWMNEDGEQIQTPYPDGDKFEAIGTKLLPILRNCSYYPQQ